MLHDKIHADATFELLLCLPESSTDSGDEGSLQYIQDVQECIMKEKVASFEPPELFDSASVATREVLKKRLNNLIKYEATLELDLKVRFAVIMYLSDIRLP